ncbi:3-oxoacyl-[acyl-carrier-protein] synthase III C-terminal domain-containing protein [Actinomadura sp. KC345]|uniref:type III polyketide synthase n=1 Tax=Actinomadura sp. KC345 TaxID=2530371 RepID=UPI001404DD3B|nr:3-oxoacyl-[acyl-carrier-protein] synthase III C-terminal domain-containing protein [Actinomadura sp. KC345]
MDTFGRNRIIAARGHVPAHRYDNAEIMAAVRGLFPDSESVPFGDEVIGRVFGNSGVRTRYTSVPLEALSPRPVEQALARQREEVVEQSVTAVREVMDELELAPERVDMLATTSYTALGAPSLDVEIATALGLRTDVRRVSMPAAGCSGGGAMTGRMHDHLLAHPDQLAVGVVCDLPYFLFGTGPMTMTRLVESALFGDGCGVIVMAGAGRTGAPAPGPWVVDAHSAFIPGTRHMAGWSVGEQGLRTFLEPGTAEIFEAAAPPAVGSLLGRHGVKAGDIGAWICHPGSAKVLDHVARGLGVDRGAFQVSYDVLAQRGNMVGATVVHILQEVNATPPPEGTLGVLMAFGPGLSCELALLQWD